MDDDQLDNVFKALGDPIRRRILDRLAKRPGQSLFEICAASFAEDGKSLSRQTISQHLDMLERAGLVHTHWSGRTKMHNFDDAPLRKAASLAQQASEKRERHMRIYVMSVLVDDQAKALSFYTEKLGFIVKHDIPLWLSRWLTVVSREAPEGTELLLEPSEHPAAGPWKSALVNDGIPAASFQVDDLDKEFERLRGLDVKFTVEPMDAGTVNMAVLDDTCGNLIQLIEMK